MKKILLAIGLLTVASVLCADGNNPNYVGYGDDATVGVVTKRARAQFGSPSKVYSGDAIGVFQSWGYNGSAFAGPKGSIEIQANQDWSTTANGTKILFKTTPDDSTTQATVATLDDNGNLTLAGSLTSATTLPPTATSFTLGASTALAPTSKYALIYTTATDGGAVVWTTYPSTAGLANMTELTLVSGSTNPFHFTVLNNLQLSTAAVTTRSFHGVGDTIQLLLMNTTWFELAYSTP